MRRKNRDNAHLPPRLEQRKLKTTTLYYYRTRTGSRIPLGSDLGEARRQWAELESTGSVRPSTAFLTVRDRYLAEGMSKLAPKTAKEYEAGLKRLSPAFEGATIDQIRPVHIRQYLDRRSSKSAGRGEIAALSAMLTWARDAGICDAPNPCIGVRKPVSRRRVYVTDAQFDAVYAHADAPLRDALDLARLTGQREGDILRMRRTDIVDGCIVVTQAKTGEMVRIEVTGRLAEVIQGITGRARRATGAWLVQTDSGQRLTYAMLRKRFDAARTAAGATWQFRDLRPKAATDLDNVAEARALLGHRSESTTAGIYRRVKGRRVKPVA